jgi:hypothetical protein
MYPIGTLHWAASYLVRRCSYYAPSSGKYLWCHKKQFNKTVVHGPKLELLAMKQRTSAHFPLGK